MNAIRLESLSKASYPGDDRVVLGVVLEPGEGAQSEAIRKAAFAFMASERRVTVHGKPADAKVIESFVAPVKLTIGKQEIAKGAWVLGLRVRDDRLWNQIKSGELSGLAPGKGKLDGDALDSVRVKMEGAFRGLLLKPEQKAQVQISLSRAVANAIALLRAVQTASTSPDALPSIELRRELRRLAATFSELAVPGSGVAKAGRKMSGSRARQFQKAIRILLEIAKELGLEGSDDKPRVAWPLDVNKGEE